MSKQQSKWHNSCIYNFLGPVGYFVSFFACRIFWTIIFKFCSSLWPLLGQQFIFRSILILPPVKLHEILYNQRLIKSQVPTTEGTNRDKTEMNKEKMDYGQKNIMHMNQLWISTILFGMGIDSGQWKQWYARAWRECLMRVKRRMRS